MTARAGLHVKKPEPADARLVALHQKNRADDRAMSLGDPAVLLRRVELFDEGAENPAGEALVGPVPTVFLMIEDGLAMNDPADVSRRKWAQSRPSVLHVAIAQHGADVAHRVCEPLTAA